MQAGAARRAAEDRARLGGRAGARRAGRPPRPRAPGRCQRVLRHGRRGRGGAEPAGRLRRAVHRAAAAPGRPRGARAAGPGAPGPHLPGRVALDAAPGQRRAAQRVVRHGVPEAGPPRRRPRHPGCARRLRRRRRARLRRRLLRGRPGAGFQPGAGGAPRARMRRAWSATSGIPPTISRSTPVATRPCAAGGSGCLALPGSGTLPRARFWRSSRRCVAGSPPPTLDAPCIASSWSGGSEMSTPGLSGRGRSWPC